MSVWWDASSERWRRLLDGSDWSGKLSDDVVCVHSSPDSEFRQHFEEVLDEAFGTNPHLNVESSDVYISVLERSHHAL